MRSFKVKLWCCIGLLIGLAVITACGSGGDFLDENGQRYTAFVSFSDADDDDVLTIDIIQDLDCDDDGNLTDPEVFTDVLADIDIDVSRNAPGITLQDYTIDYIPLATPDTRGISRTGPDLTDLTHHGSFTFSVSSGGSATFAITCMSVNTKLDYQDHWLNDANLADLVNARYTIRITLNFEDEYLEDRQIIVERTVYLGPYNNC